MGDIALQMNTMKTSIKPAALLFCLALSLAGCGKSATEQPSVAALDSEPTGTWTEGDQNSVFNRLVIKSSGRFSFQTVDFTGDVKGGYSGTWRMNGNSVRFEWGSGAKSGACDGRKISADSFEFGGTVFYSGSRSPQPLPPDNPIDEAFAAMLEQGNHDKILMDLLSQNEWRGTNKSGATFTFKCGNPAVSPENGWNILKQLEFCDAEGKSVFFPLPQNMERLRSVSGRLYTQAEMQELYRPEIAILSGVSSQYQFQFSLNFVPDENAPKDYTSHLVKGRLVSTNRMIIDFPDNLLGRICLAPTVK
jgi:hypothetical protein